MEANLRPYPTDGGRVALLACVALVGRSAMELTQFIQSLAQRTGKLDAIETGFLLALLFLDERNGPIRGSRANHLRFHLELLDIRLAESDAPDELRQVI